MNNHRPRPFLALVFLIIGICLSQPVHAQETPDSDIQSLNGQDLVTISPIVEGNHLYPNDHITITNTSTSSISWVISTDTSNSQLQTYLKTLANGVFTIQLYKGILGDSSLVYSETVSSDIKSGTFDIPSIPTGNYFLAYTVTYPAGEFPIGSYSQCKSDVCLFQRHYLSDFETLVTSGETANPLSYTFPIPALYGLLPFHVQGPGPFASNVLFLPGTMESRLYMKDSQGKEHLLWEPTRNSDMPLLAFNTDGTSQQQIYTRDIVDYLYSPIPILKDVVAKVAKDSSAMYGPFEDFMNGLVSKNVIAAWAAFPYDWRYDVSDIAANGTLVASATGTPERIYLEDEIKNLSRSSPTGKVTIIAHSNGGLVAKSLATQLEQKGDLGMVDQIIEVGAPQIGTPMSIGNLLHGDGQSRALGIITSGTTMRTVGATLPGPYDLLPSEAYFSYVETPVVSFDANDLETPYRQAYGNPILSRAALSNFISDTSYIHADANATDLQTPATLNPTLVANSQKTHDAIDAWVPPADLALTSIATIGQPTISGYSYSKRQNSADCLLKSLSIGCTKKFVLSHEPTLTSEGDGTVESVSAAANPGTQYYFDSKEFRDSTGINIAHQSLLSATPIQNEISDLLEGVSSTEKYITTTEPPYRIVPPIVVSTHSPVNIVATDAQGNQTGTVAVPGTDFPLSVENIPGSSLQVLDDEKYIYLPDANGTYSFSIQGYDVGLTTIEIGSVSSAGIITPKFTFSDVPTTSSTSASFTLSGGVPQMLSVDSFGTGTFTTIMSESSDSIKSPASSSVAASPEKEKGTVSAASALLEKSSSGQTSSSENAFILYLKLTIQLLELKLKLVKLFGAAQASAWFVKHLK
jgi:hypothetical protein